MNIVQSNLKRVLQKSRLGLFEQILDAALSKGYFITSLIDWYQHDFYPGKKIFLLRHDVDFDNQGAYRIYLIEKKLGVKSTFYFRWKTIEENFMRKMYEDGFEVSLHFETLAYYCKKNGINSGEKVTQKILDVCFEMLVDELSDFRNLFWNSETLASHGAQRNRILKIPNYQILEGRDRSRLGIHFEVNDAIIKNQFTCYISDTSFKQNHVWKYNVSPFEAIDNNLDTICLLTHPDHWNYNFRKNLAYIFSRISESK